MSNPEELQTLPSEEKTETYLLTNKGLERLDITKELEEPNNAIAAKTSDNQDSEKETQQDLATRAKPVTSFDAMDVPRTVSKL